MLSKSLVLGSAIICILLFLLISDLQGLYFLNDDNIFIPVSKNWNFLYGTSFRPVSDILLFTDYRLWGTNATGYHLTNFLMHAITSVMVFFLARKIFYRYDTGQQEAYKALTVAVLFFFYPFHSEAIFWILGRGGLLGALFGVTSLLLYLNRTKNKMYLAGAILFFLIGAFAYETIWIVPFIILLITYFDIKLQPEEKNFFIRDAVIFWSFFLLYMIVRSRIIGEIGGSPYGNASIMKFELKPLMKNYNLLVARSFLPPMQSTMLLIVLYAVLIILGFIFFRKLIIRKKLSKSILITVAGFAISFLPVMTLGVDSHDSESERFLYFPSVFAVMLIAEILFELGKTSAQKLFLFSILLFAEIFYLAKAAKVYQVSSKIARVSIDAVKQLNNNGNVYCISLPEQYKGALIFRNGFNESVAWLAEHKDMHIIKVSKKEIVNGSLAFYARQLKFSELPTLQADSLFKKIAPANFIKGNDVLLQWTDSSLLVIK